MMRTQLRQRTFARGLLGALAAMSLVIAAACGYGPNPESGALQCGSSNTCPEGYSCQSGRCWKDGAGGQSGSGGTMGTAGTGGSGAGLDKFIGTWSFNAAVSKRVRQCNDGTNETLMPWDDFFPVSIGVTTPLSTNYYCPWNLDVNAGGTTTTIRAGQMCSLPDAANPGTTFTWHGESFTLSTTDGRTGQLEASLPYDYVTTSSTGSCTMKFTGTVTKN